MVSTQKTIKAQKGFTFIELLMAISFFSFMLLILLGGILYVTRVYQSSIASKRSQGGAREASELMARYIRSANNATFRAIGTANVLCLDGSTAYEFVHTDNSLVLYELSGNCLNTGIRAEIERPIDGDVNEGDSVQLRAMEVQLIEGVDGSVSSVEYTLHVTTGGEDLVNGQDCRAGVTGSEYCSAVALTNAVTLRGR